MIKVGIIADSSHVMKYMAELVLWMKQHPGINLSHLILQTPERHASTRQSAIAALNSLAWKVMVRLELLIAKKSAWLSYVFDTADIAGDVSHTLHVKPRVSPSGFIYTYNAADIDKIQQEKFDVLIRAGSGILRGDILTAAQHGVLSFHHGDNRKFRGALAGFWEVYYKQPESGYILQQLRAELDGGNVLARGSFTTQAYFLLNQANIIRKANLAFKRVMEQLIATNTLPAPETHLPYDRRLYGYPNVLEITWYLCNLFLRFIRIKVGNILKLQDHWQIAYSKTVWRQCALRSGKPVLNPPGTFLADPFSISHQNKRYIFAEEFHYAKGRGSIACFEVNAQECRRLGTVLDEDTHFSFPQVFEANGTFYMCPETSQAGEIRLYECVEFPLHWRKKEVLLPRARATDTLILPWNNRWWMLTNITTFEDDDFNELHIYSSETLVGGKWVPHPKNPVLSDVLSARNGGIIYSEGQWYRVAQQPGFRSYGKKIVIHRIDTLNEEEYHESAITTLNPDFAKITGMHHLSGDETFTVWDYKSAKSLLRGSK